LTERESSTISKVFLKLMFKLNLVFWNMNGIVLVFLPHFNQYQNSCMLVLYEQKNFNIWPLLILLSTATINKKKNTPIKLTMSNCNIYQMTINICQTNGFTFSNRLEKWSRTYTNPIVNINKHLHFDLFVPVASTRRTSSAKK
jgi:hypothetical protein